jgi:hypothetical protein
VNVAGTLLLALNTILTALKAIPGLPGIVAEDILAIEAAVQGAIENHKAAQASVDPGELTPIDPIP